MTASAKNQTEANAFSEETAAAEVILKDIAQGVTSITAKVKELALIVVSVRGAIERSITSKKSAKAVKVSDWDGRSPEYREWYRDTLVPLIDKVIPEDFRGTVKTRLQNQVQEAVHKTAPKSQKEHLGMSTTSKATTQEAKRAAAKSNGATPPAERPTDEAFSVDGLITFADEAKVEDVCQSIAAMSEALAKRVRANDFDVPKAEAGRAEKYLVQAMSHLMTGRATLDSIHNPSGVKVAA